jgi:hypothetical protein
MNQLYELYNQYLVSNNLYLPARAEKAATTPCVCCLARIISCRGLARQEVIFNSDSEIKSSKEIFGLTRNVAFK